MIEKPQRGNLGRGLAALFGEEEEGFGELDEIGSAKEVPIEQIHPNANQPRRNFTEEALEELSASIRSNGVLQPILVRRHGQRAGEYEIVAGERRWRAAQRAQLHQVPVVVRDIDDGQALELALVENLQREDLSALEEADAYHHLIERFDYTQEALAKDLGKSRSHIANTLRLRGLPEAVKTLLEQGELRAGHARALLSAEDPEALAHKIVKKRLSVRQVERLIQQEKSPNVAKARRPKSMPKRHADKDPDTIALERDLSDMLGLKVTIDFHEEGGALTIRYQTLEQLDDVLRRLNQTPDPTLT
ncbi:MAG: ParB/RepB/Spo0J family partition protein [Kiloniellales bacterium]|nr:ParB/RepB/Spo0J family partition protein [Kiloniellales bacterium]